jgi:GntR family transcriptional regulator
LPSEAELSAHYAASRVTVRRALELLRESNRVDSRQGFGWFVSTDPLQQSLARLGTLDQQLAAEGAESVREVLGFAFVDAPEWVAGRFGDSLGADTQVLEVRRRNLADGRPFARVTVWCQEELGAELSRAEVERHPFVQLLDVSIGGVRQTIGADAASADDAEVLSIPEGSPVLRAERITHTTDGRVVLVSEHVYPAHRTEFVVDLATDVGDGTPAGLRLL